MKVGDLVLASVQQSDGQVKRRPVVLLAEMPPFGDFLVVGVSSQLRQEVADFDEVVRLTDSDFKSSGLKVESLIRLGLLTVIPSSSILGVLGQVSESRLERLKKKLAGNIGRTRRSTRNPTALVGRKLD